MAFPQNAPGCDFSAIADNFCQANLREIARGDERAIAVLWDRYFPRLVRYFALWYRRRPRSVVDEEDLALDVLERICRRLKAGKIDGALPRQTFERMLFVAARRRLLSQRRFDRRLKRDVARSWPLDECNEDLLQRRTEQFRFVDLRADLPQWIDRLPSDSLRALVRLRLEGNEIPEIARHFGCSAGSVRRKLHWVRTAWSRDACVHD